MFRRHTRGKRVGFIESEIDEWLKDRVAERDTEKVSA
jgi:predicted DNA-binding transcriptional regulator AlpA